MENNQSVNFYLEKGKNLLSEENYIEAIKTYQEALTFYLNHANIYRNLGFAQEKVGDTEGEIISYQKAIECDPQQPIWVYTTLVELLKQKERVQDILHIYNIAREVFPNNDIFPEKIESIQEILKTTKTPENYLEIGQKLFREKKYDEAIALYQEAIEKYPSEAKNYRQLGVIQEKIGDFEGQLKSYQKALELDKNQPVWVYDILGKLLREKERLNEAIATYEQGIELYPDRDELYRELGVTQEKIGDISGEIASYQKAIKLNPSQPVWVYTTLDNLYQQAEKGEEVIALSEQALQKGELGLEFNPDHKKIPAFKRSREEEKSPVRLIAFYLPQYHPIPENDEWWGKGFTEWTNVTKAKPLFEGHYQPHLPADLGFYDLRLPEVREGQAKLARKYGIYGFCYYYYWFAGKRLLDRPLDEMLESKKPDFPFCLCWANENWSRRWDGSESDILIAQEHSEENDRAFAESVIPYFLDHRYIRINGKPLLIIYRANILPNVQKTVQEWREVFRQKGIGEVYLCAALTFGLEDAISLGFDAEVQFPPHRNFTTPLPPEELGLNNFSGKIYDYRQWVSQAISEVMPEKTRFLTCMLSWDNTARKGNNAHIFYHFSLELYQSWLKANIEKTKINYTGDERLTFINAWNEWGEGTHLEPDQKYGHSYLATTQKALVSDFNWKMALQLLFSYRGQNSSNLEKLLQQLSTKIVQENLNSRDLTVELEKTKVFRIESITYKNNPSETLWYLESCQQGQYLSKNINLSGWLLNKNIRPVSIEIIQNETIIKQIPLTGFREDVINAYPDFQHCNNTFEESINLTTLKSQNNLSDLELKVIWENSQSQLIGLLQLKEYNIFDYLKVEKSSEKCLQILDQITTFINNSKPILFILHDVFPAGAQLFLINLLEWITKSYSDLHPEVLVNMQANQVDNYGHGGIGKKVFERLEKICPVYFLDEKTQLPENLEYIQNNHYSLIYVNTSVLGDLLDSIGQINTPIIVHIHELYFWIQYRLGIEKLHKYLKYNPTFIACGKAVKDNLVNNFQINPEQIEVIHAYVPVEKLIKNKTKTRAEIRQELNLSEDTFVIASCGTLDWRKGADLLVALVVLLKEKLPSKKFVYLWIGAFPSELAECEMDFTIKKAGLEENIMLIGHKTNPMNYLNASDVFVLLSKEDPFPLVMSESAVCKLPIVGFEGSGGVSELVESDAGLLAPYLNLAAMAEKIAILYENPTMRQEMGENAFRKINELYNESVLAPKIVQLIQSLIEKSS